MLTNPFGDYRFDGDAAGETYSLTLSSKKYFFADPAKIVDAADNPEDLDFVGEN